MDDEPDSIGGLPAVPAPKLDDPEDVAWALSTAEAMWSRGEHADAIRWIRKAAESASEADYDSRALELAKAAAELATILRQESAPNVAALAEALVEKEVSAELRDVGRVIPAVSPAAAAAPAPARIIGTADGAKKSSGGPPGPPPRTLKVTSSSSTLAAVTPPKAPAAFASTVNSATGNAPIAPRAPSVPPPAPAAAPAASSAATPSVPPPASPKSELPPTTRGDAMQTSPGTTGHDNPTKPRQKLLTPTDIVHVPQRRPNPDATTELKVGRELRAMVKEMAQLEEAATVSKMPSRPPPPPAGDNGTVRPSQAVHVIVWRDASGVHVAPAGTVVSSITVDAMLVALDPSADLSAWLEARKPR